MNDGFHWLATERPFVQRAMNGAFAVARVGLLRGELLPFGCHCGCDSVCGSGCAGSCEGSARRDRRYPLGLAGGSCCGGLRFASTPLCCSLWDRAAELIAFAALTAFKQPRRVRCGSALRAPIPETGLAGRAGPEARPFARHERSTGPFVSGAHLLAATEIAPCQPQRVAPAARQRWRTLWQTPDAAFRALPLDRGRTSRAGANGYFTFVPNNQTVKARQAVPGGGDFWGFDPRRTGVGARQRASKTDSPRLFERSERSERSEFAARPQAEQHSGVGAKRRPPQHEPPPGTACRAAPQVACESATTNAATPRIGTAPHRTAQHSTGHHGTARHVTATQRSATRSLRQPRTQMRDHQPRALVEQPK